MPDQPKSIMLFAAGFGTRMGPLTAHRPKPLVPVGGTCLLDHAIRLADDAGIGCKVVNAHYLAGQIGTHLQGRGDITVIVEQPDILETGGGLRNALPVLGDDPVFTMNTDAIWTGANPLRQLAQAWDGDHMDALLLLIPRERATGYMGDGDFRLDMNGHLTRGQDYVYTGAQIIRTEGLHTIPDKAFSLNLLWDSMLIDERIFGIVHQGGWCDVGRPDAIPLAEGLLNVS